MTIELNTDRAQVAAFGDRARMPDRRERDVIPMRFRRAPGTTQEIIEELSLTVGRYPDGRIGEVFIDYDRDEGERKKSEQVITLAQDIATLISIALQHGTPLETMRAAMTRAEVPMMGTMRSMPHSLAGAVLDALADEIDFPTP